MKTRIVHLAKTSMTTRMIFVTRLDLTQFPRSMNHIAFRCHSRLEQMSKRVINVRQIQFLLSDIC